MIIALFFIHTIVMSFIELFAILFALVDGSLLTCNRYEDVECQRVNVLDDIYYLNRWLVELEDNSKIDVKQIANEIGFRYLEPVPDRKLHFFMHPALPYRHQRSHMGALQKLKNSRQIKNAGQQCSFQPTIQELHEGGYEDVTGCEEPLNVRITSYNPDQVKFKKENKNGYMYELLHTATRSMDAANENQCLQPLSHRISDFELNLN